MSEREPIRDGYDGIIDLGSDAKRGALAYALAKFTFSIETGVCEQTEPEPLLYDLRDPDLRPQFTPGTDFWPIKHYTDFTILGAAFAPEAKPVEQMQVSATINDVQKTVEVFGDRQIVWKDGEPTIGPPEKFTDMPLDYHHCYGGLDHRYPVEDVDDPVTQIRLVTDHPALYPRNLWGKGYLVQPEPLEGAMMPNLEDPDDLLTPERLIVGDPAQWYKQPLPWCFNWVNVGAYQRCVFFDQSTDAWFPIPDGEPMPEATRGFVPDNFRKRMADHGRTDGPHPWFFQEASYGMVLREQPFGAKVTLTGMHPERPTIEFRLPEKAPKFVFEIEGESFPTEANVHSVTCTPAEEKLTIVFGASVKLPRVFLPGIHKYIPVAVRVNDDEPLRYQAPLPMLERLEIAKSQRKDLS